MTDCGNGLTQEQKDRKRFKNIAQILPLIKGTIIKDDGTTVDIADVLNVPKTPADPQLARSQSTFPYIRETVILENGQTCSLIDVLKKFQLENYPPNDYKGFYESKNAPVIGSTFSMKYSDQVIHYPGGTVNKFSYMPVPGQVFEIVWKVLDTCYMVSIIVLSFVADDVHLLVLDEVKAFVKRDFGLVYDKQKSVIRFTNEPTDDEIDVTDFVNEVTVKNISGVKTHANGGRYFNVSFTDESSKDIYLSYAPYIQDINQSKDNKNIVIEYTNGSTKNFEIPNVIKNISYVETDEDGNRYIKLYYLDGEIKVVYLSENVNFSNYVLPINTPMTFINLTTNESFIVRATGISNKIALNLPKGEYRYTVDWTDYSASIEEVINVENDGEVVIDIKVPYIEWGFTIPEMYRKYVTRSYKDGVYSLTWNTTGYNDNTTASTQYTLAPKLADGETFLYTVDFHGPVGRSHYMSCVIGGVQTGVSLNDLGGINLHTAFNSGKYFPVDFKWERKGKQVKIYFKTYRTSGYILLKTITLNSYEPATMKLDSWSNERYHNYTFTNFKIESAVSEPTNFIEAYNQNYNFNGKTITFTELGFIGEGEYAQEYWAIKFKNEYGVYGFANPYGGSSLLIYNPYSDDTELDSYTDMLPQTYTFRNGTFDIGTDCTIVGFYWSERTPPNMINNTFDISGMEEITLDEFASRIRESFKIED